jgi:hypothetical protein
MDRATNFSEDWIILHLTMSHRWFSVFHPPGYSGTRHAFGTRTSKEHCSAHRGAIRLETSGTDCLAYRPRKTSTRGYLDGHIATVFFRLLSSGPKDVGKKKKREASRAPRKRRKSKKLAAKDPPRMPFTEHQKYRASIHLGYTGQRPSFAYLDARHPFVARSSYVRREQCLVRVILVVLCVKFS